MLAGKSSLKSLEEALLSKDFPDLRPLKLLVKLVPSEGPPTAGGKTPIGIAIFGQPEAYLFMMTLISNNNIRQFKGGREQGAKFPECRRKTGQLTSDSFKRNLDSPPRVMMLVSANSAPVYPQQTDVRNVAAGILLCQFAG